MLRRTQRRMHAINVWVALIPVLLTGLALWSRLEYRAQVRRITSSRAVIEQIDELLMSLTEAETGQRGYLLTGHTSYLEPFNRAISKAPGDVARLRELTGDNPAQQAATGELATLVPGKLDELRTTVDVSRTRGFAAAVEIVRTNRGEALMKQIRAVTQRMYSEESQLMAARVADRIAKDEQVNFAFAAAVVATVGLLFWASRQISAYARMRDVAEEEVRALNEALRLRMDEIELLNRNLEERVQQRTAELQRVNENLQRSNDDLQRFAYVASHDLQEPLRMVGSYTGLIRDRYRDKLDEDGLLFISYAVDGAKRMQTLIQDLLTYSRIGTQALRFAPFPLSDAVSDALASLRLSIQESGAQITVGELPTVHGDRGRLALVFQNLIGNAIKFCKPGEPGVIAISAERGQGEWIIKVKDNGIGFEQKYAERILIMFQRLHSIGKYPGTGIGLAICKRIVEGHGGRIWAESQPDQGATFHFTLPVTIPAWARLMPQTPADGRSEVTSSSADSVSGR